VLQRALNANLPHDIAVLHAAEVPDGFHATYHAVRKRYRYVIDDGPVANVIQRRYAWHYPYGPLDADAMNRAAAALLGTHDFSSFESSGAKRKSSVRTIFDISVQRRPCADPSLAAGRGQGRGESPPWVVTEVEANGFLYNMVRAIVGTLVEVGRGTRPESWPAEVLGAQNRRVGGHTAPPHGLFLVYVDYAAEE
jgi:tRNA pseudouridine38-40 synthase